MEQQILVEARPARLGRISRDSGTIMGATLVGAHSVNGANRKRRYASD
jgi:hypothetical protein